MTWKNKLNKLVELQGTHAALTMFFDYAPPAPEEFIRRIAFDFEFVPASYVEFLRYSDGMQIGTFVIAGSGQSQFEPVDNLVKRFQEILNLGCMLPVGTIPGGDTIIITNQNTGILPPPWHGSFSPLDCDFSSFLADVLLGKSYPMLFSGKVGKDDPWFSFLGEMGWA